jgi:hypothetical protein
VRSRHGILIVKEPSRKNFEVTHSGVLRRNPEHQDVSFLAAAHADAIVQLDHWRGCLDSRYFLLHGAHVFHRQVIIPPAGGY